jgi:uncharacterized Zn finger protein
MTTMNRQLPPTRGTVHIKRIQQASRKLDVLPIDPEAGRYYVTSASQPGMLYEVTLDPQLPEGRCTCAWAQHGGLNCKHVLAALRAHYAKRGQLSFWRSASAARRQHRPILEGEQLYATLRPHA